MASCGGSFQIPKAAFSFLKWFFKYSFTFMDHIYEDLYAEKDRARRWVEHGRKGLFVNKY